MQTKYSYWLFKDALSEKDRNKIKKIAKKSTYKESQTEDQFSTNEERKKTYYIHIYPQREGLVWRVREIFFRVL